jgi:preprotein translocase subunit YajC
MTILWMAQLAPAGGTAQSILSLMPMMLIFIIFYFVWFLPVRKKQKALDELIDKLEKGQKVVTTGGIHGEVAKADGPIVLLKIADNVRIQVSRRAIGGLQEAPTEGGK